ncbi:MAG: cupredoxin domain-containing protein [Anaerolineae bacterium]|nr:cupredoxin domain-containing protein [Anaerolineae bacterium]
MKRTILLVPLLLLALVLVACGGDGGDDGEEAAGEQEVTIIARDIEWSTDRIEVTAGIPVVLTLQNEGALDHDFSIEHIPLSGEVVGAEEEEEMEDHDMTMEAEELDLHVSAAADHSATITFTPSEPGEYEYICTVPGHEDSGMVGTLVVR